jgi:aspartate/methionine/tyrosine aminotransferase
MARWLTSPALETWFNLHEARATSTLGMTMVQALTGQELADFLPAGWGIRNLALGYSPTPGSARLRSQIGGRHDLGPEHVLLTTGTTEANHSVLRAILGPSTNVVLQDPLYYAFENLAQACGATVRRWTVPLEPTSAADMSALERLIDHETRLVVLNSPHNPTGRVWDDETLGRIVQLVEETPHAHLLVDEIYRPTAIRSAVHLSDSVIVTDGVSKRWSLPGLRLGWVVTRSNWMSRILAVHEHATCCPARPSEQILEALWPVLGPLEATHRQLASRNRARFHAWMQRQRTPVRVVQGPVGVMALVATPTPDDRRVAERLVESHGVFTIPGSLLGCPGWLRIGVGHRHLPDLDEALQRLEEGLKA